MGQFRDQIPAQVQGHIRRLVRVLALPQTEEALDLVAQVWLEKENRFDTIVAEMQLEAVRRHAQDDPRGCIALTLSGSLVNIGPLRKSGRTVQYTSIGMRRDVSETSTSIDARLGADVEVGAPLVFSSGPIASSSPVYRVAVITAEVDLEEHGDILSRATRALTREFIEVNRELELGEG